MECTTCRNYEPETSECRKKPPSNVIIVVGKHVVETHAAFPITQSTWWCGEYKVKN